MTYSIVARDAETGMFGIGIQSHFFAAASVAVFMEPGVGAIATQAFASRQYGAVGLQLLRSGVPGNLVLEALRKFDRNPDIRQVGVVDALGRTAAFTGARCVQHASHRCADGVTAQGNMLAAPGIPDGMVDAYLHADGDFAERILAALDRAEAMGGDARGRQSAGIMIVRGESGGAAWDGVVHDERVDDHPTPLVELRRLVCLRREYARIGGILFEEGPLFDDTARASKTDVSDSLGVLHQSARAGGNAGIEAALWEAVLMARYDRSAEAAKILQPMLQHEPKLAVFVQGLVSGGFIDGAAASVLLSTIAPTRD
jgi:uncharacterized Ntn-hydrolase superfamily protein